MTDGSAPESTAQAAARAFDLRRLPDEFYEGPDPFYERRRRLDPVHREPLMAGHDFPVGASKDSEEVLAYLGDHGGGADPLRRNCVSILSRLVAVTQPNWGSGRPRSRLDPPTCRSSLIGAVR